MAGYDYDLFVIGGGSAGVRAARVAAGYGARVAVAEEFRIGGTCVIRGCIPKKLLVYAARFADDFEDAVGYGWSRSEAAFDWPTLIRNKDADIDRLNGVYTRTLEKAGVTIIRSRAEIEHRHRIRIAAEDRSVTADKILIATGATPRLDPDLPGIEHVITSNEMFHLPALPQRLAIAGGGLIGVEFAAVMNSLGVEVTLVHRGAELLRGFDADGRRLVHAGLEQEGITVVCNDEFAAIERSGSGLRATTRGGRSIEADHVLFAIGRRPHTDGLGLHTAGVALDTAGAVKVDTFSRSSVDNIFAVGDVTNRMNLTPVAIREAHAFADTVFGGKPSAVEHHGVPRAVFSNPEFGTVGLTEEEAKADYAAVDVYRSTFRQLKDALTGRSRKMTIKLVVDGDSDRVLGCHIVGGEAAEIVQVAAIAIRLKATKADFDATMALHPTAAEELVTIHSEPERFRRPATPKAE
ncbi:MAG: glutathione-disulfide reductase [Bauldia sp.]|mgnify:CR=1 FL=1